MVDHFKIIQWEKNQIDQEKIITKEADEREVRYKLENIESTQCNKTRKSNQSKIYSYSVIREYKIILIINIRFNMCVCVCVCLHMKGF